MTKTDKKAGGLVLEVHLFGGEVVHAPHTLAQVKQAVADAAEWSQVAQVAATDWAARPDLAVALTTAYRRMLVVGGGLILADQDGGVWNIDEARVVALRVTDPTDEPDAPEPRQVGFHYEKPDAAAR